MKNYRLYLVTDAIKFETEERFLEVIKDALSGGVTCLQYREKNKSSDSKLREATIIRELAKEYKVPFIINDDIDLALQTHADGIHIGQKDLAATKCRERIGSKILGVTANTLAQAIQAEKDGADYIGVGAAFTTNTKDNAIPLSREVLKSMCEHVQIPIVVIGGINETNLDELLNYDIDGVAVSSAIMYAEEPKEAAKRLNHRLSILDKR